MAFALLSRSIRLTTVPQRIIRCCNFSLDNLNPIQKNDATQIILGAKQKLNLTFQDLSSKLQVNKVWLVSAILGQHPISADLSNKLIKTLNITGSSKELENLVETLGQIPASRGETKLKDPTIRRLDELIDVYGESIKAIIREEAGDGIMSAIDCTIDLNKVIVKKGGEDEVRFEFIVNGKYLQYKVEHK